MMENHSMIKNSIVLVPFPFDGFSNTKVGPALCLTSEIGKFDHIIIAFISSKIPDEPIESDELNSPLSKGTGLIRDSVISLHKMVTIPKSLIKRKLGMIDKTVRVEIRKKMRQLFDSD